MSIQRSQYEERLATYTDQQGMLLLLKKFRPYLEMLPSMRRPGESLITIPLPIVRVRDGAPAGLSAASGLSPGDAVRVPCDVAVLMCDPDWKIKTGVEIFVFIHRPNEDFSDLLGRWRQTQLWLNKGYDWIMPPRYRHIFSEGAEETCALFVIFPETPERIRRGLKGAALPYVVEQSLVSMQEDSQDNSMQDGSKQNNSTQDDETESTDDGIDFSDSETFNPDKLLDI